jgi:hypothetical protein
MVQGIRLVKNGIRYRVIGFKKGIDKMRRPISHEL